MYGRKFWENNIQNTCKKLLILHAWDSQTISIGWRLSRFFSNIQSSLKSRDLQIIWNQILKLLTNQFSNVSIITYCVRIVWDCTHSECFCQIFKNLLVWKLIQHQVELQLVHTLWSFFTNNMKQYDQQVWVDQNWVSCEKFQKIKIFHCKQFNKDQ